MALVRWNQPRRMNNVWNEFDRMFNTLTSDAQNGANELSNVGTWSPALDIVERDKEYVVTAELPGIKEEDVNISLKDNVLTIRGEKKSEHTADSENCYYNERTYGEFQRMIRLDSDIENKNVEASYENGILAVHLPKSKENLNREIKVKFKK
ncbi:MAG: Hsp20 family protein [Candidatus Marinimicrobia bacterium]|nr:Hsp20 family protein [Candidatus Neomarinimicrobiota bacterium]